MPTSRWDVSLWDVAKWDEVADELAGDDIEAATEVSSPSIGQEHALSAGDVEAGSEASSPDLTQAHVLAADDNEAVSSVTAPAVGQVHSLTPDDVEAQGEVSSPALVHVVAGEPEINPTGIGAVADFRGEEKNRRAQDERERKSADELTHIIDRAFDGEPADEPAGESEDETFAPVEAGTETEPAQPAPIFGDVRPARPVQPPTMSIPDLPTWRASDAVQMAMDDAEKEAALQVVNDQDALELLLLVA